MASDNLHQLIRSMNGAEKRYFKLFSERHGQGDDKNYMQLFDAIDKQKEFNQEQLLEHFKNEKLINKFSIAKARLYDLIMKSLALYHSESSIEAQLRQQIHFAEILFKKTLYDQSSKTLQSAKKIALKHEKFAILIQIAKWEKELIEKDYYHSKSDRDILDVLEEDKSALQKLELQSEFWSIKSRFFRALNKHGKVRNEAELEEFRKMLDVALLKTNPETLSTETKYLYNHTYSAYYFGISNYEKSYEYLVKNIDLIDHNTELFKEEPNIYFAVLTNIIYIANQLKKFEAVSLYLDKLRSIPKTLDTHNNEDLELKLFSSVSSLELNLIIQTGAFDDCENLIGTIETGLVRFEEKLSKVRKADLCFNVAVVYFGAGEYNKALKWLNRLLNDLEIEESQDIYCFARILHLVVFIETKNSVLLPSTYKNTQRYLKSRNRVYKFESLMLDFIKSMMKADGRKEEIEEYVKLHESLSLLEQDEFEKTAFEYFDFISWAESKIKEIPFVRVIRDKLSV